MKTPAFPKRTAEINKIIKIKTVNFVFLANNSPNPSRFRYLTCEAIKNERSRTINKNITGAGCGNGKMSFSFLNISIKETNTPALTVVGKPKK